MVSIDFCEKCWSTSLIHTIIPSNESKTKRFTKILQCSVCRHWYTFDKIAPENKKNPIIEMDVYDNVARGEDKEEDEDYQAKGVKVPMDTQSFMVPGASWAENFKVILRNCKIHAKSIIIKKIDNMHKN